MNVFKCNILSIRTIFDIFFKKEGNKVTCFKESSWSQQCFPSIFVELSLSAGIGLTLKWDKVFKNGPSQICGRQPLKNLKGQ